LADTSWMRHSVAPSASGGSGSASTRQRQCAGDARHAIAIAASTRPISTSK
jgi:hypothetical protein